MHLEAVVADGRGLSQAKDVDAHLDNPDYVGGIWAVVGFDLTPFTLGSRSGLTHPYPKICCCALMSASARITVTRRARGFWRQLFA